MKTCLFTTLIQSLWLFATVAGEETLPPAAFGGSTPVEWSERLADSEMKRRSETLFKDGSPTARWDYTSGLFAHALLELGHATDNPKTRKYATRLATSFVGSDGRIATYREQEYNIDMILPGRVVLAAYQETGEERFKAAAGILRGQLSKHPRTRDGGYWHKQRYPWQMWLDGLYMGSPFLAQYGKDFKEPAAFDEVVKQILLMDQHAYDPASGLFFHGWDEKREQSWADPKTGRSACFWGRAIGWYAMAIVDVLDHLPADHPGRESVIAVLHRLADGVVRHQDPKTGLWWQVVDQGGREGNYLESSASSMFVYAMAKGIRHGYLSREKFLQPTTNGYRGLVSDRIRTDEHGAVHLTHVCEVAGLGFTTAKGRPRDGSYAYYICEPVIENDLKGVGPFILAGIEMQRLQTPEKHPSP